MYSFIHLFFHSFNKRVVYKCPARHSPGCLAHGELAASPLLRPQRRRRQWPGPGGGRQWGGAPGQGSHQGDHRRRAWPRSLPLTLEEAPSVLG